MAISTAISFRFFSIIRQSLWAPTSFDPIRSSVGPENETFVLYSIDVYTL
jgi:hypothetical protein